MTSYGSKRKLYRSRNGKIFGVCQGLADWRDLPVGMVRLIFVLLIFMAGLPLWVYFILALVLPPEPEPRCRNGYKRRSADDINAEYEELKSKMNKNREEDWDKRFFGGS